MGLEQNTWECFALCSEFHSESKQIGETWPPEALHVLTAGSGESNRRGREQAKAGQVRAAAASAIGAWHNLSITGVDAISGDDHAWNRDSHTLHLVTGDLQLDAVPSRHTSIFCPHLSPTTIPHHSRPSLPSNTPLYPYLPL